MRPSAPATTAQALPVFRLPIAMLHAEASWSRVGAAGVDLPREAGGPQPGRPLPHRPLAAPEPLGEFAQATTAVLVVERIGQANRDVLTRCPAAGH